MAQSGSAPGLGPGGPRFESLYSDHFVGLWCNGNTTDFDSVVPGSSPGSPANRIAFLVKNDKYVYNTRSYKMLHVIKSSEDPMIKYVKDDPVRPEIPADWRVSDNREILTLVDENKNPLAMVCVAFCDSVPGSVEELLADAIKPNVAIFYTIWSYANGGGRDLIQEARSYIESTYDHITRFVTLSPQTDMARRFHTKNGAKVFRENPSTTNYEYE